MCDEIKLVCIQFEIKEQINEVKADRPAKKTLKSTMQLKSLKNMECGTTEMEQKWKEQREQRTEQTRREYVCD